MANSIHLIVDESLGGVLREYIVVSEEIKQIGLPFTRKAFALEPTDIVQIDGERYKLVERKADVGDTVIILDENPEHHGKVGVVEFDLDESSSVNVDDELGYYPHVYKEEYRVLVPVGNPVYATANDPQSMLDLIANLARRVTSLEQQLKDTQNNVERQAEELAGYRDDYLACGSGIETLDAKVEQVSELVEMTLDDIVILDERTQVLNAVNKFYGNDRKGGERQ